VSINNGMMTSNTPEWETPQDFFDELDAEFHFTLDVCATPDTAKCDQYFTKDDDGLSRFWDGEVCWMNPPYGREIGKWMRKAYAESLRGATVVCLVPARTDTKWWWGTAMNVWPHGIRLVKGRIRSSGNKWNAPFPSVVIVFKP
jgi:phage N-6-adenine-methyltransferase